MVTINLDPISDMFCRSSYSKPYESTWSDMVGRAGIEPAALGSLVTLIIGPLTGNFIDEENTCLCVFRFRHLPMDAPRGFEPPTSR